MDDFYVIPKFKVGDEVQCAGALSNVGTVVEVREVHGGIQWYRVNLGEAGRPKMPETDIRHFVPSKSPSDNLINQNLDGYQGFQRLLTYQRLLREHPLRNTIYAFNSSRTQFYPYQFKPLFKFLNSPKHRLLIADEVGLGKTIEAGLILTEFRARQTLQRVLVVCPVNLCEKWQMELKRRFDEKFKILTALEFIELIKDFEKPSQNSVINGIISLESIRQQKVLVDLDRLYPSFDLVIVDEAQHMRNSGRNSHRLGIMLSRSADAMLLLTATPVHLGSENLFSLLKILDADEFPDLLTFDSRIRENEPIVKAQICMGQIPPNIKEAKKMLKKASGNPLIVTHPVYQDLFKNFKEIESILKNDNQKRRLILQAQRGLSELNLIGHIFSRSKKREVLTNVAVRKAFRIELTFTKTEKRFYDAVTDYVRAESEIRANNQRWTLIMPQRRMASSIPAMVKYYKKHFGKDEIDLPEDSSLADENFDEISVKSSTLNSSRKRLRTILKEWPESGTDSKYDEFIKILRRLKKEDRGNLKIMVFAFFKDTLLYLKNRLTEDGFKCDIISGDVKPDDRIEIMNEFREDHRFEILLSSKVGSEGLDFQFCNTLFNYDLPWNPMEIEQRIGRLDRIGQKSQVIRIYNFWIEGTIEKRIMDRLYKRIDIFERSIGELELILGDELRTFEHDIITRKLTREDEKRLIEQKEMAIETRKNELEKLKKNSAKFIGTDQFFNLEVDMIKERRRFITSEQLRRFIMDFLKNICPNSVLGYDQNTNLGYLHPDNKLREIVTGYGISENLLRFLANIDAEVPVTFDPQTAFDHPDYEFINVLHPLTQSIIKFYAKSEELNSNAHYVVLRTNKLEKGLYIYFIYRLRIHAEIGGDTLEMVILDRNLDCACSEEDAEIVLGEMIEKGKASKYTVDKSDRIYTEEACRKASEIFLERIANIRKEIEKNNNVFIDRRLQSLETSYNNYINRNIPRFENVALKGEKKEKNSRKLRGEMRKFELDYREKERNFNNQKILKVEYNDIAAGILKII